MIFQSSFGVPESNYPLINYQVATSQVNFFIVLDVAIIFFLVVALFFLVKLLLHRSKLIPVSFQKVVLLVTVPKEAISPDDRRSETSESESIKSQIAIGESWLATLGGRRAQHGLSAWLFGRNDHFSLEIVAHKSVISFYIAVPKYLREYMEQQVMAQYPEANITEVQDYNIFAPQSQVATAYLKFTRDYILPINTYRRLSVDPLNAITNALSQVKNQDGVAIQIIARSAKKAWHYRGTKVAHAMQRGKTLNEAMAEAGSFNLAKLGGFFNGQKTEAEKRNETISQPTQMQQESIKGIEEKTSRAGLDCNIRIVASASDKALAQSYLKSVADSFSQFNFYQYGNSFKVINESPNRLALNFIYRNFKNYQKVLLNTEELASLYHLPTPFLDTPNIHWLLARKLPPPNNLPTEGLLLGENIYRGVKTNIFLKTNDRSRHLYTIGMTGTGKSVLLANLAIQDIRNGKGVCVIDPHGSLVEDILAAIPKERIDEVIYFNPADTDRPIGLNMLEANTPEEQDFAIQEMIAIFYKLVTDPSMIGPMFEHNMRNAMLTLMADRESPGTIVEIPRIFTDKDFQKYKLTKVTDPMVRSFWEQEMAKTSDFHKSEMLGYLISKVGRFIENAMIRNIIGQPKSGLNFQEIMNSQKILLVNLNKGKVGEVNSNLLGLIMVAKLQMAAFSRADLPEAQRKDFYVYIDEFQNFITDSISTILAEARKYKLNLTLAHQYIGQLTEGAGVGNKNYGDKIKDAIFGNVGTFIAFRIGVEDAEVITKQMAPVVNEYDLINIERFNAYVRLLVDNQPTKAFNVHTFPPILGNPTVAQDVKEFSRWKYGNDKNRVEAQIIERSRLGLTQASDINPTFGNNL